ncbi:MAG: hypothetical protein ACO1OB_26650 [Archangium sp.]
MAVGGRRRRIGDLLVEAGLLKDDQLKAALNEQRKWGGRLGRTVIELGFVTESAMAEVLARQLELPVIDLDTAEIPEEAPKWLRIDICERYGVFPVSLDRTARTLSVATSDPTNIDHLNEVQFATSSKVLPVVATASAIERAIRRHYFGEHTEPVAGPVSTTPVPPPAPPASSTAPARGDTSYELDSLLGNTERSIEVPIIVSSPTPVPTMEAQLRREIAVLREKVESLEEISTSQVRALRSLLEILIESGLVTRDEYLEKLHEPE